MTDQRGSQRPIGWWLKEADAVLNAAFDRAFQGEDVDRRGWQILASLHTHPVSRAELAGSLAAFEASETVDDLVGTFIDRGWVEESGNSLRLTEAGTRLQQALAPRVDEVRHLVRMALPRDDYVTLTALLEQLVDALRPTSGR